MPSLTTNNGIHTPTISSTTTREGSSPHIDSTIPDDQTPKIVNTTTNRVVAINKEWGNGRISDKIHHIIVAKIAPAVPGAIGQ
ncbi:hypothetical protein AGMMS49574_16610 [Bacteroidia bacterium]|nr:hypothetical protein AGMMS49574_16610 [Bacteroidia bacterium]